MNRAIIKRTKRNPNAVAPFQSSGVAAQAAANYLFGARCADFGTTASVELTFGFGRQDTIVLHQIMVEAILATQQQLVTACRLEFLQYTDVTFNPRIDFNLQPSGNYHWYEPQYGDQIGWRHVAMLELWVPIAPTFKFKISCQRNIGTYRAWVIFNFFGSQYPDRSKLRKR